MDFAYTPKQEALRQEVRQFIEDHVTPQILAEIEETGVRSGGPQTREMYRKVGDNKKARRPSRSDSATLRCVT